MKTTVEIPDTLFRQAKSHAAQEGKPLKDLFIEGLELRLRLQSIDLAEREKPWMHAFGGLSELRNENIKIDNVIRAEFDQIDEDQWA